MNFTGYRNYVKKIVFRFVMPFEQCSQRKKQQHGGLRCET